MIFTAQYDERNAGLYIQMEEIKCKHANVNKKATDESIYIYDLGEETIALCPQCNMILASEILKQLAIKVFV